MVWVQKIKRRFDFQPSQPQKAGFWENFSFPAFWWKKGIKVQRSFNFFSLNPSGGPSPWFECKKSNEDLIFSLLSFRKLDSEKISAFQLSEEKRVYKANMEKHNHLLENSYNSLPPGKNIFLFPFFITYHNYIVLSHSSPTPPSHN